MNELWLLDACWSASATTHPQAWIFFHVPRSKHQKEKKWNTRVLFFEKGLPTTSFFTEPSCWIVSSTYHTDSTGNLFKIIFQKKNVFLSIFKRDEWGKNVRKNENIYEKKSWREVPGVGRLVVIKKISRNSSMRHDQTIFSEQNLNYF